jgi:hypothetical protein
MEKLASIKAAAASSMPMQRAKVAASFGVAKGAFGKGRAKAKR